MITNKIIESSTRPGWIIITGPCFVTKTEYSVEVKESDWLAWQLGKHAQDAFPYLPAEEREFLISNTSPEGWKQLFGDHNH